MLDSIFNMENGFWSFANKLADMVFLGILCFLFCLPIVTIGASTTAFWNVMIRMAKDEESYIWSNFWKAFRKNFRKATVIWFSQAGIGILLIADLFVCLKIGTAVTMFVFGVIAVLGIVFVLCSVWLYPSVSMCEGGWTAVWKHSVFLMLCHLPYTLACLLLVVASAAASVRIPYAVFVFPVLACYVQAKVMVITIEGRRKEIDHE